jgi:hypothetical protein
MKKLSRIVVLAIVVCIFIFLLIFLVLRNFGSQYNQGLTSLTQTNNQNIGVRKSRLVRRVTIFQDENTTSCLEVTPDGVVRSYDTCGGTPTDVNRLSNPKNIFELIRIASQIDTSLYTEKPKVPFITLVIESDEGKVTVYIPTGDGGGGGGGIGDIIDLITGDLPEPTATLGPFVPTPTPTMGGVSFTPTPSPLISATFAPSPTSAPTPEVDNPFLCGFSEGSTGVKPLNVSNYICSTQPSPPPGSSP